MDSEQQSALLDTDDQEKSYTVTQPENSNRDQEEEETANSEPRPEIDEYQYNSIRWSRILRSGSVVLIVWNIAISLVLNSYQHLPSFNNYFLTYGVYTVLLIFSPLAVYLTDTRWGRQKTIINSLCFIFWSILLIAVFNVLFTIGFIPVFIHIQHVWNWRNTIAAVIAGLGFIPPCVLGVGLITVSLVAYNANVIQFGWEQLRTLPTENAMLFIHWFVWSSFLGQLILKLLHNNDALIESNLVNQTLYLIMIVPACMLVLAITLIIACCHKKKLFPVDNQCINPYTITVKVVKYAMKKRNLVQNSYEDNEVLPSRIDSAKEQYGGPFTNEMVEDVKSFLVIIGMLLTLGPTLAVELAASEQLPHFGHHLDSESAGSVFIIGAITPLVVVVIVPLYTCLLRPCIKSHTPGTLKRIGLGMILFLASIVYCCCIDMVGHITTHSTACFLGHDYPVPPYSYGQDCLNMNETAVDKNGTTVVPPTCLVSLGIPLIALLIPYILNGLAYLLFYIGTYEFIWTQSPRSMKGLVIGSFFAIKGVFQLTALLVLYVPFTTWSSYTNTALYFPSCGFVYWLINAIIALVGIITFMWRARVYRNHSTLTNSPLVTITEHQSGDLYTGEEQPA